MRELSVFIEIGGKQTYAGSIRGNHPDSAVFSYAAEYREQEGSRPISLSLPFSEKGFTPEQTRNFFEGLLPEGFVRRCVAEWMHVDEKDYLSILAGLGSECIGAVKITERDTKEASPAYQKLSIEEVQALAKEGAAKSADLITKAHLSLTGASGKVGLYYDETAGQWYLPIGDAPSTHIVKQSHVRLKGIVMNEQLCMMTAGNLGLDVPDSFVINMGNAEDDNILFATKRYDRAVGEKDRKLRGLVLPYRLHQEDFAQAMGISSSHKYEHYGEGYLKKSFRLLRHYSANPMEDQLKLWDIEIFNYLIGNTDNHLKNLSLVYGKNLKSIRLAPAYDIISTTVYESSIRDMSVSVAGVYNIDDIKRSSFQREAENIGLGAGIAMKRFDYLAEEFERALKKAGNALADKGFETSKHLEKRILETGGVARL